MEVPLRSSSNVQKVLELLAVIKATSFEFLPEQWRDRQSWAIDYHPGGTSRGGYYVLYDPWRRHKIYASSGRKRADETWIILDDLKCGWVHPEEDFERTLPGDKSDDHLFYRWPHPSFTHGQLLRVHRILRRVIARWPYPRRQLRW